MGTYMVYVIKITVHSIVKIIFFCKLLYTILTIRETGDKSCQVSQMNLKKLTEKKKKSITFFINRKRLMIKLQN